MDAAPRPRIQTTYVNTTHAHMHHRTAYAYCSGQARGALQPQPSYAQAAKSRFAIAVPPHHCASKPSFSQDSRLTQGRQDLTKQTLAQAAWDTCMFDSLGERNEAAGLALLGSSQIVPTTALARLQQQPPCPHCPCLHPHGEGRTSHCLALSATWGKRSARPRKECTWRQSCCGPTTQHQHLLAGGMPAVASPPRQRADRPLQQQEPVHGRQKTRRWPISQHGCRPKAAQIAGRRTSHRGASQPATRDAGPTAPPGESCATLRPGPALRRHQRMGPRVEHPDIRAMHTPTRGAATGFRGLAHTQARRCSLALSRHQQARQVKVKERGRHRHY
jgi:hypothetical protein